jgi:hypothetical protein
MSRYSLKVNLVNNKNVFELLDTKSQVLVFSKIHMLSIDNYYNNDHENRLRVLKLLEESGKKIGESRLLSILKEIADKGILERKGKGLYKIKKEYIEKIV